MEGIAKFLKLKPRDSYPDPRIFPMAKYPINSMEFEDNNPKIEDPGLGFKAKIKAVVGFKTLVGLFLIFLMIFTGLVAGLFIMDLKIQSLNLQNQNLEQERKSQGRISEGLKSQNQNFSLKLASMEKSQSISEEQIQTLLLKNKNLTTELNKSEASLKTFQEFINHSSLHEAAKNGNGELVQLLLDQGIGVDTLNGDMETPLLIATMNGHANVVNILLKNGAKRDLKKALKSARRNQVYRRGNYYNQIIALLKKKQ